jgi:hypothetical protein
MTASEHAKASGLKNLLELSEMTGVSTQTLNNWHKYKPFLFNVVVQGCKALIGNPLKGIEYSNPHK